MQTIVTLNAVLFLHSHYQTGELVQTSILELSGDKIPISVIEYLGSDDCVNNEDFDGFALDEPVAVSLVMEWEEGDSSVGLIGGWYIASMELLRQD